MPPLWVERATGPGAGERLAKVASSACAFRRHREPEAVGPDRGACRSAGRGRAAAPGARRRRRRPRSRRTPRAARGCPCARSPRATASTPRAGTATTARSTASGSWATDREGGRPAHVGAAAVHEVDRAGEGAAEVLQQRGPHGAGPVGRADQRDRARQQEAGDRRRWRRPGPGPRTPPAPRRRAPSAARPRPRPIARARRRGTRSRGRPRPSGGCPRARARRTAGCRRGGRCSATSPSSTVPSPWPCHASATAKATSALSASIRTYIACATIRPSGPIATSPTRSRPSTSAACRAAARRLTPSDRKRNARESGDRAAEEVVQRVLVRRLERPDVQGGAVAQDDLMGRGGALRW